VCFVSVLKDRANEYGITVEKAALSTLKTMSYQIHSGLEAGTFVSPATFEMGCDHVGYLAALTEIDLDAYELAIIGELVGGGRAVEIATARHIFNMIRTMQLIAFAQAERESSS